MTCDRCNQKFMVKRGEEADECRFHWGKAFTTKVNGMRGHLLYESWCSLRHVRREEACIYMLLTNAGRGGMPDRSACFLRNKSGRPP